MGFLGGEDMEAVPPVLPNVVRDSLVLRADNLIHRLTLYVFRL